jgi:hypothetical protein
MNLAQVVFGFFVLLAATLNLGFFVGDISDPAVHNEYELFAAVLINLIATVLKFGDRTQLGAVHLATSLVADLQLIAATLVWVYASQISSEGLSAEATATVVSLSGGALLANLVSVGLLVSETVSFRPSRSEDSQESSRHSCARMSPGAGWRLRDPSPPGRTRPDP